MDLSVEEYERNQSGKRGNVLLIGIADKEIPNVKTDVLKLKRMWECLN
jgi:hypothetical protein